MLSEAVLSEIKEHAEQDFPAECCGLILCSEANTSFRKVFKCKNVQDQYHLRDPKQFPRTSSKAFIIDPQDFRKAELWSQKNHFRLDFIYHSHINVDSYLSEEDRKFCLEGDTPIFENVKQCIISVVNGKVKNYSIYNWSSVEKDFLRTTIEF